MATQEQTEAQAPAPATEGLADISAELIDTDASKVVRRLMRHGHEAYLVGGCVRDLLLHRKPKDFDVATSATPNEIKKLFRNSRIIGRRFRLAHIFFGPKIIETSTFRAQPVAEGEELLIRRDNVFGTAREDALRRDFTINGLFLDVRENRVIDHVEGLADLRSRRIRTIGDPRLRIQEDPVRIIRAVKFATRLGFVFDPTTEDAMVEFRGLIAMCSVARVLEEIYRLLGSGHAAPALRAMHQIGALDVLLPEVAAVMGPSPHPGAREPVLPIQDLGNAPHPSDEEEAPPRDAEPAPVSDSAATPEKLESFRATIEQLIEVVVGRDDEARLQAGRRMWEYLEALDRLTGQSPAPTARSASTPPAHLQLTQGQIPHSLLLAATICGLAERNLRAEVALKDAVPALEHLVQAICSRLRVSRRDRERLKQILVAQRRMVHRGKRRRPSALLQRDYFPEAWQLFQMRCAITGEDRDSLERWQQLMDDRSKEGGRRRRSRRRRSRPRQDS